MSESPDPDRRPPRAVLLDHGGVVARSVKTPERAADFASDLYGALVAAGIEAPEPERLARDIEAGLAGYKLWKNGNVRRRHPREIRPGEFWADLVAADWPDAARAWVEASARPLCRRLIESRGRKQLGPGMMEFFDHCRGAGIRTGLVANTMLGEIVRDYARQWGTDRFLAVEVYSDETTVRKPDPEAIWIATRALGLDPSDVWFVGDNYDRDVLCARRAGAGRAILMRPADKCDPDAWPQPDATVEDGFGLVDLLRDAGGGA